MDTSHDFQQLNTNSTLFSRSALLVDLQHGFDIPVFFCHCFSKKNHIVFFMFPSLIYKLFISSSSWFHRFPSLVSPLFHHRRTSIYIIFRDYPNRTLHITVVSLHSRPPWQTWTRWFRPHGWMHLVNLWGFRLSCCSWCPWNWRNHGTFQNQMILFICFPGKPGL